MSDAINLSLEDRGVQVSELETSAKAAPRLRSAFGWTFAGNVIYALASWSMLSAVTKLSTGAAVGQYALGISIVGPIFVFATLQLRTVHVTDARSEFSFADYFTLRCLGIAAAFLAVVAIVILGHYDWNTSAIILLVGAAKAIECLGEGTAGLMQKVERLDQAARSLILRGAVSVPTFALVLFVSRQVALAAGAVAVAWIIVLLFYDFRIARELLQGERFSSSSLRKLWRLLGVSLPLGIVVGIVALNGNLPRYVVQHYLGPTQLGIFVSLAYLISAINLIVYALGQSVSVRLARMFAAGDLAGFIHILRRLVFLGVFFGVIAVPSANLLGKPVLRLLYRPEYALYSNLLPIMAVVAGITAVGLFLDFGMTAARCFRAQVPVIAGATVAGFLVSAVLVPAYGLQGAAFGLLAAAAVFAAGNAAVLTAAIRYARYAKFLRASSAQSSLSSIEG